MTPQGTTRSGQLPPRFKELMQGCRQMARSLVTPLYMSMLDNSDVALLEFAEKAESNAAQAKFFEAMQELKRKRHELEHGFFKALDAGFRDFINGSVAGTGATGGLGEVNMGKLSLVDKGEVEESLPVQNMVAKANANYSELLYGLKQRLAVINGGAKLEEPDLPGGPQQLAFAARDAFRELAMDGKTRMVIYAVFERYVMRELKGFYEEYNRRLVNAGILQNLKYEIRKQHDPRPVKAGKTPSKDAGAVAPADDLTVGEETFQAIRELMASHRREAARASGGVVQEQNVSEAVAATSRTSMLGTLDAMQTEYSESGAAQRFNQEVIENVAVDKELLERVKVALVDERQRLYGGVDRRRVASADSDVIDLVGMLFEFMLQDEQLPNSVKALLSRLHTPFLKVAILDKHLFTEKHHPARRLLDMMAEAGARWVTEDDLERGIFPCMRRLVERVLLEFKDDLSLFDELLEEFSAHLREIGQKAEVIEKRTVEAADGQARLQLARERAHEEIDDRVTETHLQREARDFLRQVWGEKLTFILLRERDGDESEPWKLARQLLEDIVWSVEPKSDDAARGEVQDALPTLRTRLREGLDALRAYGRRDNDKMFAQICEWQDKALQQPQAVIESAQRVEQESQKAAAAAVPPAEKTEPEQQPAPVDENVAAMAERLGKLEFDTWFEFTEIGGVRTHRWKLAWYSTVSSKYMFVDAVGVKAAEFSRFDLARKICNGEARILQLDNKPFLDRALENILAWLGREKVEAAS